MRLPLIRLIALFAAWGVPAAAPAAARDLSSIKPQSARVLTVRRVLRNPPPPPFRYPRIQDFDLYFSFRVGRQTYCGDYETAVLQEINDVTSLDGKDVEVTLEKSKKRVILYTFHKRKLKARLVRMRECSSAAVDQSHHP